MVERFKLIENSLYLCFDCDTKKKNCSLIAIGADDHTEEDVSIDCEVTIPSSVLINNEKYVVTSIGGKKESQSVLAIDEYDLSGKSLELFIPDSITKIHSFAFAGTHHIKSLSGMKGVTSIGESAFRESNIESIIWPENCKTMQNHTFYYSNIKKFSAGKGLSAINDISTVFFESTIEEADFSKSLMPIININKLFSYCPYLKNVKLSSFMSMMIDQNLFDSLTNEFEMEKEGVFKKKPADWGKVQFSTPVQIPGKKFVITGTLPMVRSYYESIITSKGGFVSNSVTSSTDYVLVGDKPGATKINAAKRHGIPQITLDEFKRAF